MKQRTKRFLSTAYLFVVVGVMTACNSSGGDPVTDPVTDAKNPTTDVGKLTVANAPVSVGGNFVAVEKSAKIVGNYLAIIWGEESVNHVETLLLTFNLTNSQNVLDFSSTDFGSSSSFGNWICSDGSSSPTDACKGITVDKTAGVVTFANQVLSGQESSGQSSTASNITLNGTLHFTPPSGITPKPTPTPGPTPVPTPTPPPGGGTIKGNNSALLNGVVVGTGFAAAGDLRKQIAATVLGTNTSFSVGTAYATRSSINNLGDYAYVILPVTNTGSQALCSVSLAGITYRDVSGIAIGVPGSAYVNGSVGKLSSTSFTDTCLASGETGMVADIKANLYTAVAKMEFTFESSTLAVSIPTARVIPQSYAKQSTFSSPVISVANVGSGPAQIGGGGLTSIVFLLDSADQPVMWGFAFTDPNVTSVVVPALGTGTIPSYLSYDGLASKLLTFVDFEDAPVTARLTATFGIALPAADICASTLSTDELMLCRNEIRNQRLDSLKSTYDAQVSKP